jgi:hypothetical protein
MTRLGALVLVGVSLVIGGCASPTTTEEELHEGRESELAASRIGAIASSPKSVEVSIHGVRNPKSTVVSGAHVRLAGPTIKVTAATPTKVWIQEAADSGGSEIGTDAVAWRAIVVVPRAPIADAFAKGQRVVVEGKVEGTGAHRTIIDATFTSIGAPTEPYAAHCERDGRALAADELDAVLVTTAGTTEGYVPPGREGTWTLATCFSAGATVTITSEMVGHEEWLPTWHWVTGLLERSATGSTIVPRDAQDIVVHGHDDACL